MIAAGFGDIVAKYTSVADWKMSHVVWGAAYSEPVARRMEIPRDRCMEQVDLVGAADSEGIRSLIVALIEAGLCMLEFGGSQPAGQSEHYISHYLEMKLVREGRPPVLHGAKTGMATVIIARYYEQIRTMTREEAARRLQAARYGSRAGNRAHSLGLWPPDRSVDRRAGAVPRLDGERLRTAEAAHPGSLAGGAGRGRRSPVAGRADRFAGTRRRNSRLPGLRAWR